MTLLGVLVAFWALMAGLFVHPAILLTAMAVILLDVYYGGEE